MVKIEPLPTVESTQIRPAWFSTIDFTIANPKPVPDNSPLALEAR